MASSVGRLRTHVPTPIRAKIRSFATIALSYHRAGGRPDVAIVSSPRSGSTWLMELLYTQPGIKYVDEPEHKTNVERLQLLPRPRWEYTTLSDEDRQALAAYLTSDRHTRWFGPWNPCDKRFDLRTNRRVLKIIRMNAMISWLSGVGFEVVYLVRHPLAQSISQISRRHQPQLSAFLKDEAFCSAHLTPEQFRIVSEVDSKGTDLETFVLQWALENIVPLRLWEGAPWPLSLTYEECVMRPREIVSLLAETLALPDPDRMLQGLSVPSHTSDSSHASTRRDIRSGEATRGLGAWRSRISKDDERRAFELLHALGLDAYEYGSDSPASRLLHFEDR